MMTGDQKKIKRYVTEIERALRMPLKTKARINHDLATEIQLLKEQGLTADEIIAQMGTPEEVAGRFNEEMAQDGGHSGRGRKVFCLLVGALALLAAVLAARFEWMNGRLFDSAGVMVIGGADGPTSIFIAGKISSILPFALAALGLALCMASQFSRACKGRKVQIFERIFAALAVIVSAAGLWLGIRPLVTEQNVSADTVALLSDAAALAVLIYALFLLVRAVRGRKRK